MPTHSVHKKLAKEIWGKEYGEVNQIMDAAAKYVPNPSHRDYGHSLPAILGLFADNPEMFRAALLHLWLDQTASADPEFHRFLRIWAELK